MTCWFFSFFRFGTRQHYQGLGAEAWPSISQAQSLKIRGSPNLMLFWNIDGHFLKPGISVMLGRVRTCTSCCWASNPCWRGCVAFFIAPPPFPDRLFHSFRVSKSVARRSRINLEALKLWKGRSGFPLSFSLPSLNPRKRRKRFVSTTEESCPLGQPLKVAASVLCLPLDWPDRPFREFRASKSVSPLHKTCLSTAFEAVTLWNGRSA